MAETKTKTKTTSKQRGQSSKVWTDEERAAMQERAKELKKAKRGKGDGEADVLEKIGEMTGEDRKIAERLHAIVKEVAPNLTPRTWYGMPAYANEAGKVICYFTASSKFKERYSTFGFNADANLDDGAMWPTSWAVTEMNPTVEKQMADLIKKAVS